MQIINKSIDEITVQEKHGEHKGTQQRHRISHIDDLTKTVFREKGKYIKLIYAHTMGTDDSLKKNHSCVYEINHYGLYFKINNMRI